MFFVGVKMSTSQANDLTVLASKTEYRIFHTEQCSLRWKRNLENTIELPSPQGSYSIDREKGENKKTKKEK